VSSTTLNPASRADTRAPGLVDWGVLILPGVIWGASFLFIAEGLQAMAPNGVTFMRIAVGFLTLTAIPAARAPIAREDRLKTALLGMESLDYWNQVVNQRAVDNELKKMSAEEKRKLAERLLAEAGDS